MAGYILLNIVKHQAVIYSRTPLKRPPKMSSFVVTYERRSLTRGSHYSDLTWNWTLKLVFWKTGCLGVVVAYNSGRNQRFNCILYLLNY